ncbi:MAG: 3-phosphoshikimate 1-carboxyvinyltransferase [Endomicrobiia bacterium]|nr:3-phosphoshikimate 1-carboxyvinyltransferase [Endomicrobiia bacterium]
MKRVSGKITVSPDKSVSHRALMISSIARGKTIVKNFLRSDDCLSTMACLRKLGVVIKDEGDRIIVDGRGPKLAAPTETLYAGNSGTTVRLLSGILAAQNFKTKITGDGSLSARPMKRIERPLKMMGASVRTSDGKLPMEITGGNLKNIDYASEIASAQVKSCVLLAGLYADGKTTFREPMRSRDHTERMLSNFGAKITSSSDGPGFWVSVDGPAVIESPGTLEVPGDISSAAFFMVAAAILPGSRITILNVGVNPTRTGIIAILRRMGARVEISNRRESGGEPSADITVEHSDLIGIAIGADEIPLLIDELPIIAVAASQAVGATRVTGAEELRVKETDRIKSVVGELLKMGARIEELKDGFVVEGPTKLKGAAVASGGDHRMAMSLAVARLAADGETRVINSECASVSFPEFYGLLNKITAN